MKTLSCKLTLKEFGGNELKDREGNVFNVGNTLGNMLGGRTSNPNLAWQIGKKFATEETIELKAEDIVFLKKEVEANEIFGDIIRGQLIEILESK